MRFAQTIALITVLIFIIPFFSFGGGVAYGDFEKVIFIKNYDGDTITVDIPGLHPLIGDDISVRIYGIDTPEIRGKCERERRLAKQAKRVVYQILSQAKKIVLKDVRRGKYFRIVATVKADGVNIADILIQKGLAVPYYGGRKRNVWCK